MQKSGPNPKTPSAKLIGGFVVAVAAVGAFALWLLGPSSSTVDKDMMLMIVGDSAPPKELPPQNIKITPITADEASRRLRHEYGISVWPENLRPGSIIKIQYPFLFGTNSSEAAMIPGRKRSPGPSAVFIYNKRTSQAWGADLIIFPGAEKPDGAETAPSLSCTADPATCHAWMNCFRLEGLAKEKHPEDAKLWLSVSPNMDAKLERICPTETQKSIGAKSP